VNSFEIYAENLCHVRCWHKADYRALTLARYVSS